MRETLTIWLAIPVTLLFFACQHPSNQAKSPPMDLAIEKVRIVSMLDSFNRAAAKADFEGYFNFFTSDATICGTDAREYWDKKKYMYWAKPYFDKKTTWDFNALNRNIYFSNDGKFAWFDELLNTQMKICRGSGVLVIRDGEWKLQQYVLSMTIPNGKMEKVVALKAPVEDSIINDLAAPEQ